MSDPKLISPMLDNFAMGHPMSNSQGIQCCPAMPKDSDKRYIVKIISIPASQVQLDALLLTGAYSTKEQALDYFKGQADRTVEEYNILKRLSNLEGFLAYENVQIVEMEDGIGYQVYLLSPYKMSLERFWKQGNMTHLNAVNLGLDMCAALAVCRRAGYLYADLKPENIFISEDKEFRIGDLGFIALDSLRYASLADHCLSRYTAPEVCDPLATINETVDIYAAGMVLYQAYNDGKLPFADHAPTDEALPSPAYADYEMAEIILKAIDPDPEKRWKDPVEMGQALVAYMQKNGANDVPIVPVTTLADKEDMVPTAEEAESSVEDTACEDAQQEAEESQPQVSTPEESPADPEPEDPDPETEPNAAEEATDPDDTDDLSFMASLIADDTVPSDELSEELDYNQISLETSDILAQADELLSHKTPEGVVAPEPVFVSIPEPIKSVEAENSNSEQTGETASEEIQPSDSDDITNALPASDSHPDEEDYDEEEYDDDDYYDEYEEVFSVKKFVITAVIILLLGAIAFCGYHYYKEYYLQNVASIELNGYENSLTVSIVTEADESLLTIVCTDNFGGRLEMPVENGSATFTGLNADTLYKISVEIDGFHELTGSTSDTYTTPKKTTIINFTPIVGTEDGAVTLRFTVDGQNADSWRIVYSTEGEEEKSTSFTGQMVTITGLTVGKKYTFRLESDTNLYITGTDTIEFVATAIVTATDLQVTGCSGGALTAQWSCPEGQTVKSWSVRCYNDSGYDQTLTTNDTKITFTGLDSTLGYTVEVTAEGMTIASRTFVSAGAITVTNPQVVVNSPTELRVTWDFEGPQPNGMWLLMFHADNTTTPDVIRTGINEVSVPNWVPGATYTFSLQTESGVTMFQKPFTFTAPEAEEFIMGFSGKYPDAKARNMRFNMCQTPEKDNWDRNDVRNFTDSFKVGQKASFLVKLITTYNTSSTPITIMYVIRDAEGNLISNNNVTQTWTSMWFEGYCELDVPQIPQEPGTYSIEIYFSGAYAHKQNFTVTE